MHNRAQVREFLASRRARITPDQAGLPAYGGNRRVAGLRREEVALLAGVSIDYYVRLERGRAPGASESVLDGIARARPLGGRPCRLRPSPPPRGSGAPPPVRPRARGRRARRGAGTAPPRRATGP